MIVNIITNDSANLYKKDRSAPGANTADLMGMTGERKTYAPFARA